MCHFKEGMERLPEWDKTDNVVHWTEDNTLSQAKQ